MSSYESGKLILQKSTYDNGTLSVENAYVEDDTFVVDDDAYDNDLVPSWNRGKPKFMAFLRAILRYPQDIKSLTQAFFVQNGYLTIDSAEGEQLDVIGQLVGCTRILPVAFDGLSRKLQDDQDYRLLVKAKIAQNHWDGTMEGFNDIISTLFPNFNAQVVDSQNCSVQIKISSSTQITAVQTQMLLNGLLLPCAAGVKMTVNIESQLAAAQVGLQTGVYSIGFNAFSKMT